MSINTTGYWNMRGGKSFLYKGECFYTIAPIPYYIKRRNLVIKKLMKMLNDTTIKTICDYGCGDGYYLHFLSEVFPDKKYYGMDISIEMIDLAKKKNPNIDFVLMPPPPPYIQVKYNQNLIFYMQ